MISDVETKRQVKTVAQLMDTRGMLVNQRHLDARRPNENGELKGYVPGHGGDVVWVEHADGKIAAYSVMELDEIDAPTPTASAPVLGDCMPPRRGH